MGAIGTDLFFNSSVSILRQRHQKKRCLCTRRPLDCLDDHWPECPSAIEERIKRFGERQKKSREMKVRHHAKNLCGLLKEGEMDAIPDEEVRNLHALFEIEFKKRML